MNPSSNRPRAAGRRPRFARSRPAFTMIEMLISLTATMLMMGAVVTLFGVMSESVSGSRALLEISDKLRATRNRLQADLLGATATMRPPLRPENDEGYLEIIEGPNFDGNSGIANTLFGDCDDDLLLTVRSRGEPFIGKFNGATIESQTAEVIYFLARSGNEPMIDAAAGLRLFTLYRRVLLVAPGVGTIVSTPDFYDRYDVSAGFDNSGGPPLMVPNTLGDLTKRENRFAHYGTGVAPVFPFLFAQSAPLNPPDRPDSNAARVPMIGVRLGDDILMTNVLAFDVQVYDPGAPINVTSGVALEPRDPGYTIPAGPTVFGAYVDLGYAPMGYAPAAPPFPQFNLAPATQSGITPPPFVYDTWSLHYENNGIIDATGAAGGDLGTNGLDDGGIPGVVDDLGEFDTLPPYSAPLRGIRVTIRVYEPSSKQVRQVTVVQDFLPE